MAPCPRHPGSYGRGVLKNRETPARSSLDGCPPMTYNTAMFFIETPVFAKRIQNAMDDSQGAFAHRRSQARDSAETRREDTGEIAMA